MSDNRKKSRRRRSIDEAPELTPIEKSIAKYVRFECPTKKGMLMGTQVPYFNGTKAVDCLVESKWSSIRSKTSGESTKESKHPICFSSRHDAVQVNNRVCFLFSFGFFVESIVRCFVNFWKTICFVV